MSCEKTFLVPSENKSATQPARKRSLSSSFMSRYIEYIIGRCTTDRISRIPASLCG